MNGKLTLTKIDLTLGSWIRSSKAFLTASVVAPPPISQKLAGEPPWSDKQSIVAEMNQVSSIYLRSREQHKRTHSETSTVDEAAD